MQVRQTLIVVSALFVVAACADDPVPIVTVADSAGVTLRSSDITPDRIESLPVAGPVLELGTLDGGGPDAFGSVQDAILVGERLVVVDGQAIRVEVFDLDGAHVASLGRSGEGPGEYSRPSIIGPAGDSVFIWDTRNRRISIYEMDGEFVRSVRLTADRRFREPMLLESGYAAISTLPPAGLDEGTDGFVLTRDSTLVGRFSAAGDFQGAVAREVGTERLRQVTVLGGGLIQSNQTSLPFFRSSYFAGHGSGIVGGPNDRTEVKRWSADGKLISVYRYPRLDGPIEQSLIDAYESDLAEVREDNPTAAQRLLDQFRSTDLPEIAPAFTGIETGGDGSIWLREFALGGPESWLIVRDDDGAVLGRAEFPERFRLLSVSSGRAVGVWQDEYDVSYLHVYSVGPY